MSAPVWVGVLVGTPRPGETLRGEYVNLNEQNAFDTRWTPSVEGEYILKFYVDPENVDEETDETNNVAEVRVTVKSAKRGPVQKLDLVAKLKKDRTPAVTIKELQEHFDSQLQDLSTTLSDGNADKAALREFKHDAKREFNELLADDRNTGALANRKLIDEFFARLVDDF